MNRRLLPRLALAACLVAVLAVTTSAAKLPEGVEQGAAVEGINEYRLPNGLRVLLFPDPSKQTTTVNITYMVGSRHEGYGESGMAHLLEHLLFKGTPRHPDIPQELTSHGARPNGTTWYDRTNYFETFAATDENLDWALDLEADRMVNSFIAKKDLDSEFSVVRNEFEMGENSPQNVLLERMMSSAYLWHNYGKSTIGSRADIERVPIDNLKAFYKNWYRPDNATLVVAGKFDEAKTLEKIARIYGAIPRPSTPLPTPYTVEPAQDGERTVTLRRVGDVQAVGALYHIPAGSHPDFAAADLLTFILGDSPSGRLYKSLVETKKASSTYGWGFQLHDPGVMIYGAEVRLENSLDEAQQAMLATIDELSSRPPTKEEVERARADRLKDWDATIRNSQRAAIELSEWQAMGDWRLMFLHRDRLEAVTVEEVGRVARTYLRPENRTIGVYMPTKEAQRAEVPARPDVAAIVRDYKGREGMAMGEAFDPSPAAIEARTVREKLAPGMDLLLVPKKTRGAIVQATLNLHFGDEKSLQGRGTAGELAGGMLMRGTKTRTRQQIEDEISKLKARISVGGGYDSATATIETKRENLAEALRLVADMLRAPAFPESEFELMRQETLAALEDAKSDPQQKASTSLMQHLYPWPESDPRFVESPEESIARVNAAKLEELRLFHADFYGASEAQIAIVGDFDPADVRKLVGDLFGGWKSAKPFARLSTPSASRTMIDRKIEAPDKEMATMIAGLRLPMRDDHADYPALVLGNWLTGGGFLNSRLATRIRQKDGLSYGVGSFFRSNAFDPDAYFGSYAIYAPQNSDRLVTAYREEIARVLDKGFTAEEIEEGKTGWLQGRQVSRANDPELARTLAARSWEDRTIKWDADLEAKIASLTPDQVRDAMRRHLSVDRISIVQSGDFANARATLETGEPATVAK